MATQKLNQPMPTTSRASARLHKLPDDPRDLVAFAALDAADAVAPIVDEFASGVVYSRIARKHGVSNRALWSWLAADPLRMAQYNMAREARALTLVDEAHELTAALVESDPDDAQKVQARVKHIQWDAQRSSRQYADRSITESRSQLDITIHMQESEMSARLASLIGTTPPERVVDGEIVE